MSLISRVEEIIAEPLKDKGYNIVRIQYTGLNRKVLQIMIERIDDVAIVVEDCAKASRVISVLLDVNDTISEAYVLEVSSPGMDRPLTKISDYHRFVGKMISLTTYELIGERKNFQGSIEAAFDDHIRLVPAQIKTGEPEYFDILYSDIRSASLYIDL